MATTKKELTNEWEQIAENTNLLINVKQGWIRLFFGDNAPSDDTISFVVKHQFHRNTSDKVWVRAYQDKAIIVCDTSDTAGGSGEGNSDDSDSGGLF